MTRPKHRYSEIVASTSATASNVPLMFIWVDVSRDENGILHIEDVKGMPVCFVLFQRIEQFRRPLRDDEDPNEGEDDVMPPTREAMAAAGWELWNIFDRPKYWIADPVVGPMSEDDLDPFMDRAIPLVCSEHSAEHIEQMKAMLVEEAARAIERINREQAQSN